MIHLRFFRNKKFKTNSILAALNQNKLIIIKQLAQLTLFFLTLVAFSQEFSISGTVHDVNGAPISFSNVILLTETDAAFVAGTTTNTDGSFVVGPVEKGHYLLKITFIGYEDYTKTLAVETQTKLNQITLIETAESLDEVNITYKKPTVKKEPDRIVFNIENSALTQGNIMQVMKSTPGVLVVGGKISVKHTEPTIFINGRKVHLSSDELSQLLESSDANNIKSIEVITNPSAKYDATSGAVIDIIMSKNLVTGYRGNIFTNYTQGVFPRYNVGTGHFFKSDKINFYTNYSYSQDKINRNNEEETSYFNGTAIDEVWKSRLNRNTWSKTHNLNFNFDFLADDKNTLSLSATTMWLPDFEYKIANRTNIYNNSNSLQYYFLSHSFSNDTKQNLGFDFDYEHKFNTKGEALLFNAHFTTYDMERDQRVTSRYFTNTNAFTNTTSFVTDNNQETKIYSSKLDYKLPVGETFTFETGLKYSNVNTNSNIAHFDMVGGTPVLNPNNTNAFDYNEDVFAGYANLSKDWSKWSLVAGLRAEQTNIEGLSVTTNQTANQEYLKWFPNASISFNPSENISIYTNYKKSIIRPNYRDLNPFRFYLNDNTSVTGNPNLKPVVVDHGVFGIALSGTYFIEAYYKKMDDNIYEIPIQDNANNTLSWVPTNFDETIEYGFDFVASTYLTNRWYIYAVTSFYNVQDSNTFQNENIVQDQWSNYSVLQNNITLLKDNSLNIDLALHYSSKNLQGFRTIDGMVISTLAISKSLWNKKAIFSVIVEDLFNDQDYDYYVRYSNQANKSYADFDNRYIKLGFRYKFGNTLLQTNNRSKNLKERERLNERN